MFARRICGEFPSTFIHLKDAEKDLGCRLLKNAQIQGVRNPEE
jgi:hypothetical protein